MDNTRRQRCCERTRGAYIKGNPAIPHGALERGGGKTEESDPFLTPGGDVPERFADLRQRTQVVVLSHQILVTPLLERANRPDNDLMQLQWTLPPQKHSGFPYTSSGRIQHRDRRC